MTKIDIVKEEHAAAMGGNYPMRVTRGHDSRYSVYWQDGQIERRDVYTVDYSGACLESCYQRYAGETKWTHLG